MSTSKHFEKMMAGYHRKDSMREKAERDLGPYVKGVDEPPKSFTSKDREKTRLYAKGGKVHKMPKTQTDMKIPKREKTPKVHTELYAPQEIKKGGHLKHKKEGRSKLHKHELKALESIKHDIAKEGHLKRGEHHAGHHKGRHGHHSESHHHHHGHSAAHMMDGGQAPDVINPMPLMRPQPIKSLPATMKKGGHSKKHHRKHYDEGGEAPMLSQLSEPVTAMKRGGHMKHSHHKHHEHHGHHADGGTIYERQMVGERPSHHAHHYNYEAEMKGERAIHKPSTHSNIKAGKKADMDGTHYAMGGVGKMRHKQSSKGSQKMGRYPKGY